jgi:deoxyribose-phosphate aldolase
VSEVSPSELPGIVELSLARSDATAKEVEEVCRKARAHKLHGVCVSSSRIELAVSFLEDTELKVTAFIGSPSGANDGDVKRYETEVAIDYGAQEIEVALNIGRLKDGDRRYVLRELRDIAEAADERTVKVDLHPHLLTREETLLACGLVLDSGAHFVCASSGDSPGLDYVKLLREAVGDKFGVKAAGRLANAKSALALVEAGATRLGMLDLFPELSA